MALQPTRWLLTAADLSTDPDVFPLLPGQEFVAKKSPQWSTGIRRAASGREIRIPYWSFPIWSFQVKYEFLRQRPPSRDELGRLFAFFNSRQGRAGFFYYLDPNDNQVSGQVVGVGDGVRTAFQFNRTVGGASPSPAVEPVSVLWTQPTVTVAGVATTAFTVGSFGALVFTSPPAAGAQITWSGRFLYLCRFDDDQLDAAQMFQDLWSQDGVNFVTIKP